MPPVTSKELIREATKSSVEGVMHNSRGKVPIMPDTMCFIDKSTTITWKMVHRDFIEKEFLEYLWDREVYINIKIQKVQIP